MKDRRSVLFSLGLTTVAALIACPEAAPEHTDAGGADAASADAASADALQVDAAAIDASSADTAGFDAALPGAIYVDAQIASGECTDYDSTSRSCGSGTARAFDTLAGAAAVAAPGDTVLIRGGSYGEVLQPQRSGQAGAPISYRGYPGESAVITGATLAPGVELSGRSHLVIEGLEVRGVRRWLYALDTHDCVIRGNTFAQALDSGGSSKTGLFFQEATRNRLLDNLIDDSTQDNLSLIKSDRNLVQGNTLRRAAHTLWTIKCGNHNVLRGNDFHNEHQKIGEIYDCDGVGFDHQFDLVDATRRNLVEDNVFSYTASSGDASPYAGIQYAGQEGIIRRNRFHDTVGPGLSMTLYGGEAEHNTDNRVYHNTFARTDFAGIELSGSQSYSFGGNVFKNNVLARSRFVANDTRWSWYTGELDGQPVQLLTGRLDGFLFDTNCFFDTQADQLYLITHGSRTESSNPAPETVTWWQSNHPSLFTGSLEVEPGFVDEALRDLRLDTGSALRDAGTFLTTASGDGSGTTLAVADARYFYDGFGIPDEVGDLIQLDGDTQTARVVAVDIAASTLTLDAALSWSAGQGVALAYSGERPDVGAYESR